MTMREFKRRKEDEKEHGNFTIQVLKHKTGHKGPVNISVFCPIYKDMVQFVRM